MSYILGALKKAEKDRKSERALDFENWDQEEWSRPNESNANNNLILYIVLSVLMLVLILFAVLAYKILIMPNQAVPTVSAPAPIQQETQQQAQQQIPVSRSEVIDVTSQEPVPVYVEPNEVSAVVAPVKTETSQKAVVTKEPVSKELPPLPKFSGHIYFPNNPSSSRVFSGSNSFKEGDEVNGYLVERIREGQAILSHSGKEFRVKLSQ